MLQLFTEPVKLPDGTRTDKSEGTISAAVLAAMPRLLEKQILTLQGFRNGTPNYTTTALGNAIAQLRRSNVGHSGVSPIELDATK